MACPRSYRGRFAPSPSGPLHFGSLLAAVGSYLDARAHGGSWLVRIEDLDTPRVMPGAPTRYCAPSKRLGLQWDGAVMRQSERLEALRGGARPARFRAAAARVPLLAGQMLAGLAQNRSRDDAAATSCSTRPSARAGRRAQPGTRAALPSARR